MRETRTVVQKIFDAHRIQDINAGSHVAVRIGAVGSLGELERGLERGDDDDPQVHEAHLLHIAG